MFDDGFHILVSIHAVVVNRVAIGDKFALGVPIPYSKRAYSQEAGNFSDSEKTFWHAYIV